MTEEVEALIDKWRDVLACADDNVSKNLAAEILVDLEDLHRMLVG
jgi:hypothetical protein